MNGNVIPFRRENAQIDRHVYHRLPAKLCGKAGDRQHDKLVLFVKQANDDPNEDREKEDRNNHAGKQAEFLADDRKDIIGVSFGQANISWCQAPARRR